MSIDEKFSPPAAEELASYYQGSSFDDGGKEEGEVEQKNEGNVPVIPAKWVRYVMEQLEYTVNDKSKR